MTTPTTPTPDGEQLWTMTQCAQFLQVSRKTIEYWRQFGEDPPSVKLGRHVRYVPADVRAWVAMKGGAA